MLTYALFDLLHLDGVDVADAPLTGAQGLAAVLEGQGSPLAFSSMCRAMATRPIAWPVSSIEGIISKRADGSYHSGRSDDWRKTKQLASDEFVVGYTAPRAAVPASARCCWPVQMRSTAGFTPAGWVRFSDELIGEISKRIKGGGGRKPTAYVPTQDTDLRAATWFEPRFVVEVFYRGIGGQKLLRQASLKAVRADKDIADLADSDRAGMALAARTPAPRDLRAPGWHRWRIARRHRCPLRARSCSPATVTPSRTCGITTRQ